MRSLIQNTEIEQKTGTLEQAGLRYGFGRNSIRKIANDAGAVIKIGKSVRINFTILDQYMENIILHEVDLGIMQGKHYQGIYRDCKKRLEAVKDLAYLEAV